LLKNRKSDLENDESEIACSLKEGEKNRNSAELHYWMLAG
jgi:hypothetical protein